MIKAALIAAAGPFGTDRVITFQVNPDKLTRSVEPRAAAEGGDRGEVLRLSGPPKETISLTAEFDAALAPANVNPLVIAEGIGPALAALELLVYPKSALMIANAALAMVGIIEILPTEAPLVLFSWGPSRIIPVKLGAMQITELEFDQLQLKPVRADVELKLTVLSFNDQSLTSRGSAQYLQYQIAKEALGARYPAGGI